MAGTTLPKGLFDGLTEMIDLRVDPGHPIRDNRVEGSNVKKCSTRVKCKNLIRSGALWTHTHMRLQSHARSLVGLAACTHTARMRNQ